MAQKNTLEDMFFKINTMLGGSSVEVELEDDDFKTAFEEAVLTYRNLSYNAINEGWAFMELRPGVQVYQMPREVDSVKGVYRQRAGVIAAESFEPFSASFLKQILVGANSQIGFAGFATYDFAMQYQEMIGRMFGEHITFYFRHDDSSLFIMQNPRSEELVAVQCSYLKSVDQLLSDGFAYRWLKDYTDAVCREILGEKYRKYATMPGAQGGVVLKGNELVNQGKESRAKLEKDVQDYADGGCPPLPFIG